jgi:hypothetical protein
MLIIPLSQREGQDEGLTGNSSGFALRMTLFCFCHPELDSGSVLNRFRIKFGMTVLLCPLLGERAG